ncbi:hypothetical protein MXB_4597 [Myxobolus squamalis]|nr:hypothetical protein MXB_4597 [Myxobolus squamalis]
MAMFSKSLKNENYNLRLCTEGETYNLRLKSILQFSLPLSNQLNQKWKKFYKKNPLKEDIICNLQSFGSIKSTINITKK